MAYEEVDIENSEPSLEDVAKQLVVAIGSWENRGNDDMSTYSKVNEIGATGRYQFMPTTLTEDSKKYFGKAIDVESFKKDPSLQDELMYRRTLNNLRQNRDRYGNIQDAIRMTAIDHYGHNGGRYNAPAYSMKAKKVVGESPNDYADSVIGILNNGGTYTPTNKPASAADYLSANYSREAKVNKSAAPPPTDALAFLSPDYKRPSEPAKAETKKVMPLITPDTLVKGIAVRAAQGDKGIPSGARMDVLTDIDVTSKREQARKDAMAREERDIAVTKKLISSAPKREDVLGIPDPVKKAMKPQQEAFTDALLQSPEYREGVKSAASEDKMGADYRALVKSGKIDPKETSFDAYKENQSRLSTQASMIASGPTGAILAMASGANPVAYVPPQLGRQVANLANAMTGNVISAVDPENFAKFMSVTNTAGGAQPYLDITSSLVGAVGGMKLLSKIAGPALAWLTPEEQMGAILAAQQAPGNVVSVAKGDKSAEQALVETALDFATGFGAIGAGRKSIDIAREVARGSKVAPYVINALAQSGINTASEVGRSVVTGEELTPEGIGASIALGAMLSTNDIKHSPERIGILRDAIKVADERIARLDVTIDDIRRQAYKTENPDVRREQFKAVQNLIEMRKAQAESIRPQRGSFKNIAEAEAQILQREPQVAQGETGAIISNEPQAVPSPLEGGRDAAQTRQVVEGSGGERAGADGRLQGDGANRQYQAEVEGARPEDSGRNSDVEKAGVEISGRIAAETPVSEPAEAAFGGRIRTPKAKPADAPGVEGEIPKFEVGQKVYTYQTTLDAEGNPIRMGVPVEGRIVEEKGAQYIKVGNRKVPVDANTVASGSAHPLTTSMASESAPSSFIMRAFADEATRLGLEGKLNKRLLHTMGKAAQRMGLFQSKMVEGEPSVEISIAKQVFADPNLSRGVFGHEVGHLIDYIGDAKRDVPNTLSRGNLIGHAKTLYDFREAEMMNLAEKDLRAEYEAIGQAWNPIPANADKVYVKYRNSAKELTADFFSAIFNNPELVKQKAPQAYQRFVDDLQYKPKVKEAFETMRDMLTGNDEVAHGRMVDQYADDMFNRASDQLAENMKVKEERMKKRSSLGKYVATMFNKYSPLYDIDRAVQSESNKILKKNGLSWKDYERYWSLRSGSPSEVALKKFDQQYSPEQKAALGEVYDAKGESKFATDARIAAWDMQVAPDVHMKFVEDISRDILRPLQSMGVSDRDASKYLLYTSVDGAYRAGLANPGMMERVDAERGLATLRSDLGAEKFSMLEEQMGKFRDLVYQKMAEAKEAGLINDDAWNIIEQNKDNYSRFAGAKYVSDRLRWSTNKAEGVLGDIGDPLLTTTQLILATDAKIRMNNAAKAVVSGMPDAVEAIKPGTVDPTKLGPDVLRVYEGGEQKMYRVNDPFIMDMFKYDAKSIDSKMTRIADIVRGVQRGIFITYSPSFILRNPLRDFQATVINTGIGSAKRYGRGLVGGVDIARAKENPVVQIAERQGLLRSRGESLRYEQEPSATQTLMRELGYKQPEPLGKFFEQTKKFAEPLAKPLREKVDEPLKKGLNVVEAAPKLSALEHYLSQGIPEKEAAMLASIAGTPDTRVRGKATRIISPFYLFFNTNLQGTLRGLRLMRDPQTRSGYIARQLTYGTAPKLTQWALQYGWLIPIAKEMYGEDSEQAKELERIQSLYARMPEDTKRRYLAFPIEETEDARGTPAVNALTIPMDESAITWSSVVDDILAATGGDLTPESLPGEVAQDVVSMTVPGEDPNIKILKGLLEYYNRGNIYDSFRQQEVLNEGLESEARDTRLAPAPLSKVGLWAFNTSIGSLFNMLDMLAGITEEGKSNVIVPGWFTRTSGGTYELLNKERIRSRAESARESREAKEAVEKVRKGIDPKALDDMYSRGELTKRQYEDRLKQAQMTAEDYYRSTQGVEDLEGVLKVYEEIGAPKQAGEIIDIITGKQRKKKK